MICRIPWISSYWRCIITHHGAGRGHLVAVAIPINRLLGATGINVATRVMALIVASVGINFILTGIKNKLPGLTH
jgi:small neutral amino acid transporter SnatA (MarC family)